MKRRRTKEYKYNGNEIDKVRDLVIKCKDHNTFKFEGLLINGYRVDIVKAYVKENPSKKFRTWLIDKGLVLIKRMF